jgi:L-asparaginase
MIGSDVVDSGGNLAYQSPVVREVDGPSSSTSRILVINTRSSHYDDDFQQVLFQFDELQMPGMPVFHVQSLPRLNMSADQGHRTWTAIAEVIEREYDTYTGFVIQHGTDTMVYTATALSFMLENLGKPVMFTGSLIPSYLVQTDLKRNITLAMLFAQNKDICEVCIVFAERLFRANRTLKSSRHNLQPFASPHFQPLAILKGNRVMVNDQLLLHAPRGRLRVHTDMSSIILTIKLIPGMEPKMAQRLASATKAKAVVLCAFGTGNVPARRGAILHFTQNCVDRGLLVVVCTQNRYGSVDLSSYETGRQLISTGAVGAGEMTVETTIVKLKYLFGRGLDVASVRRMLTTNLRGETNPSKLSHL